VVAVNGSNTAATCGAPPLAPAALDANASDQERAEHDGLVTLDELFGRLLRSEALVYRGTLDAHGTQAHVDDTDHAVPAPVSATGTALALLSFADSSSGDWMPPQPTVTGQSASLVLHALSSHQHVALVQAEADRSGVAASSIDDDNTFVLLDSTCEGCAPDLWSRPSAIVLADLVTRGSVSLFQGVVNQGGSQVDVPVETDVTANLTVASPCSLTFDEVAVVDTLTSANAATADLGLTDFVAAGNERVWHTGGSTSVPGTSGSRCFTSIPYTIDLFVDVNNLEHYGVRNYAQGAPQQECPP
jgi:hypothetical protein